MDTNKIEKQFNSEAKAEQAAAETRSHAKIIESLRTAFPGASLSSSTDKSAALRQLGFFPKDWSDFTDAGWEKLSAKAEWVNQAAVASRASVKRSKLLDLVTQIETLLEYAADER